MKLSPCSHSGEAGIQVFRAFWTLASTGVPLYLGIILKLTALGPTPISNLPSLKPEAVFMLQEAFLRGHVSRGEMIRVSGWPKERDE